MELLHRLKTGHTDEETLLADDDALVIGFPHGNAVHRWLVASDNLVRPYARRERRLNGHLSAQGMTQVSAWTFDFLNAAMFEYLVDTVFAGQQSKNATIYTYVQKLDTWRTFQCVASLPEMDAEGVLPTGNFAFREVTVTFARCVLMDVFVPTP